MTVPLASIGLGAKVIEKHFILDRKIGGPDAMFSMEPGEFKNMVNIIKESEKALGDVTYELSERVTKNKVFSRSLFIIKDIKKGDLLTEENIRSIRPGYGLSPKYLKDILGKKVKRNLKRGIPLKWEYIE